MTGGAVAIVGMACRYPDATTPEELWENVLGRRRAFQRLPESPLSAAYQGAAVDQTSLTHAGVAAGLGVRPAAVRHPGAVAGWSGGTGTAPVEIPAELATALQLFC